MLTPSFLEEPIIILGFAAISALYDFDFLLDLQVICIPCQFLTGEENYKCLFWAYITFHDAPNILIDLSIKIVLVYKEEII